MNITTGMLLAGAAAIRAGNVAQPRTLAEQVFRAMLDASAENNSGEVRAEFPPGSPADRPTETIAISSQTPDHLVGSVR